jgi:hypothetical protein
VGLCAQNGELQTKYGVIFMICIGYNIKDDGSLSKNGVACSARSSTI